MKTVLIVEDNEWNHIDYKKQFLENSKIVFLSAYTLKKGEKLFLKNPNIDLIIMDGCVDNEDKIDSLPLIKKIRETYTGKMVAASSSPIFAIQMMDAGCDYETSKGGVPSMIKKLLNL